MPDLSPEMMRLLAAAAELRAAGRSWERVAARLGRSADTCRRWPKRFPKAWEALYQAAEQNCTAEGRAEATATLREQLRLADTKEKRDAAKALLSAAARDRRPRSTNKSTTDQIAELAQGLTDAQREDLRPTSD